MERLTNKDWHTTKFLNLDNRVILKRLWELENMLEDEKVKQKECYVITTIYNTPEFKSVYSIIPVLLESDITAFTKEVRSKNNDVFLTTEDMLFKTKEEAEDCLKWLEKHSFRRYAIRGDETDEFVSNIPPFQHLEEAIQEMEKLIDTGGFNRFELYILDSYRGKIIDLYAEEII